MSLSGLDAPQVVEAHEATLKEPGGWFLLQYISRDEVALHSRGTGGQTELRTNLSKYTDLSPLYGFLLYRRRKLILKYVPDGTSRLLQARTTVHFQTVLDHFSNHDATFDASSPEGVSDAALSSTCTLHTAGSFSSAHDSAKKQRLDEIGEDTEEPQSPKPDVASVLARIKDDHQSVNGSPAKVESQPGDGKDSDRDSIDELLDMSPRKKHRSMDLMEALSLDKDQLSDSEDSAVHSMGHRKRSREGADSSSRPQTTKSTARSLNGWKPKVRLFTRTVDESPTEEPRERAKLPTGLHIRRAEEEAAKAQQKEAKSTKSPPKRPKSSKSKHSKSQKPIYTDYSDLSAARAVEESADQRSKREAPQTADTSSTTVLLKPQLDQNKSIDAVRRDAALGNSSTQDRFVQQNEDAQNASINAAPTKKAPAMTPERQRLMKALELRKKQQRDAATARADGLPAVNDRVDSPVAGSGESINGGMSSRNGDRRAAARALLQTSSLEAENPTVQDNPAASEADAISPVGEIVKSEEVPSGDAAIKQSLPQEDDTRGRHNDYFARPVASSTGTSRKSKRRTIPKPLAAPGSEAALSDHSSDGSYMDDLHNATVHEAMRVSVPHTPMTPTLNDARAAPKDDSPELERQASVRSAHNALYKSASRQGPEESDLEPIVAGKALSPVTLVNIRRPSASGTAVTGATKKSNMSSGISSRIRALEERSQRSASPASTSRARSPTGQVDLPPNHARNMSLVSRPSSRGSSRLGSAFARSMFKPMDSINDDGTDSTRDPNEQASARSFTARIVRSENQSGRRSPERKSPKKPTTFQRSMVTVDQSSDAQDFFKQGKRVERPPSVTSARPTSRGSTMTRPSLDFGLNFMNRKKSESKSDKENKSPTRTKSPSIGSLQTVKEDTEDKKSSMTSKFFKRMSGLSQKSRKSPSDDGTRTLSSVESRGLATAQPAPRASSYIVGDLNVQFPDTLFWKRKWVEVDGNGSLVLSNSRGTDSRTPPKKFHLSTFDPPIIPGPDRQELPYSIILESINGGTLQFASDDRVSQAQVLRRLSDAHKAWTT